VVSAYISRSYKAISRESGLIIGATEGKNDATSTKTYRSGLIQEEMTTRKKRPKTWRAGEPIRKQGEKRVLVVLLSVREVRECWQIGCKRRR